MGAQNQTHADVEKKLDKVWAFICAYAADNARVPTHREIQSECRISSTSVVHYYICKLEKRGKLVRSGRTMTIKGAKMMLPVK